MIFLLASIILTSYLTLSFKVLERFRIPVLQTIVFNHWVCVVVGSVVNGNFPINIETPRQEWFPWALMMGLLFVGLFNLVGWVTQKMGVAISSVANKMSLVIPFVFSIYLYNENGTALKIFGIVVALTAVLLTCWPKKNTEVRENPVPILLHFLMPAILFAGSGLLDTIIKYTEHRFLKEDNKNEFLITCFGIAAFFGTLILTYVFSKGKQKFDLRSILAGIMIGIPNYFSIWCLVKVLNQFEGQSSAIIPINNMGIVLLSSVMAYVLFKEKISLTNWIGILLSIAAIGLIAYG